MEYNVAIDTNGPDNVLNEQYLDKFNIFSIVILEAIRKIVWEILPPKIW